MPFASPEQSTRSHSSISMLDDDVLADDVLADDDVPSPATSSTSPFRAPSRPPPARPNAQAPSLPMPNLTTSRSKESFVLGIDYGTTATGIAFTADSGIQVIRDWGKGMDNDPKVRSAISYANPQPGTRSVVEWGSAISADRVSMVNTKLELEPQESTFEELDLTLHVLKGVGSLTFDHMIRKGPNPAYTSKAPMYIVTDYLREVFKRTSPEFNLESLQQTGTPVDIVITIPVGWSYEAKDSIFKALRGAGFNKKSFPTLRDTILLSEPEAASYYTARHLRDSNKEDLKENDCFVLCDAGGGTVDVVSFQVKKLQPDLELERITEPKGGKYGSALIDTAFKTWVRDILGETTYAIIDPNNAGHHRISPHAAETGAMRDLIKAFKSEKHLFGKEIDTDRKISVTLPKPLQSERLSDRVTQGAITVQRNEMKKLMNPCVNGVLGLIHEQIAQVEEKMHRRVWNVLLVGGFGSSPYLQQRLQQSLSKGEPPVSVHWPSGDDTQTTAVVQGAVIYGLEKARHRQATYLSAVTKSYGVVVNERFKWFARKGDLMLSNEDREITSRSFHYTTTPDPQGQDELPIYCYNARNERDDHVPKTWSEGQNEVRKVGAVKCNLSKHLNSGLFTRSSSKPGIGPLTWKFKLSSTNLLEADLQLHTNGKVERLGQAKIRLDVDSHPERPTLPRNSVHDDY